MKIYLYYNISPIKHDYHPIFLIRQIAKDTAEDKRYISNNGFLN